MRGSELGIFGYLSADGREEDLKRELKGIESVHGRLILARGDRQDPAWCHNVWENPQEIAVPSIGVAAKALRSLGRNWVNLPNVEHRRAALIQSELPKFVPKPIVFPAVTPSAPLGSWILLARDRLLAAPICSSPFAHGEPRFAEPVSDVLPPSSAYLKLWEAFTWMGVHPRPGDRCLDLGACPGGWTWVLQRLGAETVSVDKAPLAPEIVALSRVTVLKKDAFRLKPAEIEKLDWLCSDVICYPERLLELVQEWIAAKPSLKMVCTIKFQGPTDFAIVEKFRQIPGSRVRHMFHNKHEITWCRQPLA